MDLIFQLLGSQYALYALGAVAVYFVYQQLASRLKFRGGGLSLDGLVGRLLGQRYADAKIEKAAARLKKADDHLGAGRLYEDLERYQEAADVYVEGEEFFAAATVFERIGKGERAGELYLQAGDHKKAAQLFVEIGKPGRAAQLFLEKGNTLEAARLFGLASQWDKSAELYWKAGYPQRAGEAYEKHGQLLKAAEAYERHFTENVNYASGFSSGGQSPDNKSALLAGRLYQKAGDLQRAYQILTKGNYFKEAAGALEAAGEPARAAELYMRGEDPERAALAFERAGDSVRAATLRGEVAFKADRIPEAAAFFKQGKDYLRSAELFESVGLLAEAASAFEAAESWVAAGGVYVRAGLKERGAAAYERGSDHETAGKLYEEAGNDRKATECFARAGLTFKSGEAAVKAGDRDRGIAQLQRVSPNDENYRPATELLARLFIEGNLPQLAVERLLKVLGNEPVSIANLALYYWLGVSYEAAGSRAEALSAYKRIQAEDLSFRDVAARAARLGAGVDAPFVAPAAPVAPSGAAAASRPAPTTQPPGMTPTAVPAAASAPVPPMTVPPASTATPKPTTAPPAAGRPRFTLGDQIGAGPLGSLHRGEDQVESKAVLLRLLAPELLAIPGALQALTGDLKNAAAVNHAALVRTLGFVELGGRRAIVTDWVTGRHFGEAIAAGHKLPPGQIASLSKALLQALAAVHAKGLAHGSVQPSNVMVSAGQVRLADFGLGRVRQRFPSAHRAPEGGYSAAADVYAAAALFYQLMTGVSPIGTPTPAAPGTLVSGVPEALDELLVRCLAPRATDRPSSEEALQAL